MLISLNGLLLCCCEQLLRTLGERTGKSGITCLVEQELTVAACCGLAVDRERVLALCLESGVEAEHIPVTAVNSFSHLILAVDHTALDGVHLAGCIGDDD